MKVHRSGAWASTVMRKVARRTRWLALPLSAVLVATLLGVEGVPASAQTWTPPKPKTVAGVKVDNVKPPAVKQVSSSRLVKGPQPVAWPKPAAAEVELAAAARGASASAAAARVRVGSLPVKVGRAGAGLKAGAAGSKAAVKAAAPGRVRVRLHDRATAKRLGVSGLLLSLNRTDGQRGAAPMSVELDYSSFAHAYGGDWASRLRLVQLPACALEAGKAKSCGRGTPLRTVNNVSRQTLVADVSTAAAGPTLLAAEAAPSGDNGDYTATSLSAAGTWQVSNQTGDFSWSVPLRMPPSLSGPTPSVSFAYSSGSIDGRTGGSNNQGGWLGDGWESWPGFIERKYASCSDDNPSRKTGDQCWFNDNATLSLNGHAGELVQSGSIWRLKNDDGTKVERITDAARGNGDNDNEYWKVTTPDGVQFFFGYHKLPGWASGDPVTDSTWTVPVFGNNDADPCHNDDFDKAHCNQAWRWNLDYVVDPHNNTLAYFYGTEQGAYARNSDIDKRTTYDRGGFLRRAEYGMRRGSEYAQAAPLRVVFDTAERCLADCWSGAAWTSAAKPAAWPDTPWEQFCAAAPCREQGSPTFWSARRLTQVTTQQRTGTTSYGNIESWRLRQEFISAGNGESIPMWLRGVTRTGHVGGTVTDPEITFNPGAEPLANRVDGPADQRTELARWRIKEIDTESGGKILVTYSNKDCSRATLPAAHANAKRCMPAYFSWPGTGDPTIDWFHKYVVTRVDLDDVATDQLNETTFYDYLDSPAWHYLDDEITKDKYKTWGDWRGYGRVRVRHGDASGKQTAVEYRYLRGMDGDKQPNGTPRDISVTDWGGTIADHEALRGFVRQETTLNGATATTVGGEVASTVNDPWKHGPTATRTRNGLTTNAWKVQVGESRTRTALAAGGFRTAKTATDFNADGLPTTQDDFGDVAVTGDETCTRTSYARNSTTWMIDKVSQVEMLSRVCDGAPATAVPSTVLSRTRTFYDQYVNEASFGDAPTKGDVVRTEDLDRFTGSTPVYVRTTSSGYDVNGRVTSATDARGHTSTTAYTTANGGLVIGTVAKNPLGHAVTTVKEPAWDLPTKTTDPNGAVTELDYDALGKLTAVWLPGRARTATPNTRFSYLLRKTGGPTAVTTETLLNTGAAYKKSINLYDGFLRQRQTQTQATKGGRLLVDTFHNTLGQVEWESQAYYDSTNTAPGTDLGVPQGQIPGITETVYDGAGRETEKVFKALGVKKWSTTTRYGGDRQTTVPPAGGTATTALTDVRDRTTVLRQYKNPADAGSNDAAKFDATSYTYDLAGNLRKLVDPAGDTWAYTYDLRGNQTSAKDPDKGLTETTYDAAGNVATSKDANGNTLAYAYDALGRKTSLHDGSTTGTKRAEWIFDTLPNGIGKQTKSIRWVGAAAYESRVDAYNTAGQPTSTSIAIPSSEGALCASETAAPCVYTTAVTYKANGATSTTTLPKAGDLPSEKLTYGYNDIGEQTSMFATGQIYVGDVTYDRVGQLTGRVFGNFGNRVAVTSTFDEPTRRLKNTNVVPELKPEAANYTYDYDDIGNITKINEAPQGQTADTQCFAFDHLRRLNTAWTPANSDCAPAPTTAALGGPAPYWHAWEYDKTGNRTVEQRHAAAGTTTFTYTHPTPGENTVRPHAVTGVTMTAPGKSWTRGFTYDNAGNMSTRMSDAGNQQTLAWDTEGRLDKVTEAGKDTSFIYDADGKRLIRKDTTKRVLYLPGGSEVSVATSATVAKGTRYYTHKDTTIATRTSAGLHWIVGDHHGTAEVTIKASSDLTVTKRRTLPFGEDRGATPGTWPDTHDKGFVGGTKDPTGLTHLGARLYDQAIGRFISVDPVIDTKDPQQLNAYAYSNNNPVTMSDPSGEFWESLKKAGSAVASAASTAGNAVANTVSNVVESVKEDPLKFAVGLAVGIATAAAVAAVCATGVGCLILAGAAAGAAAAGAEYGVDVGQGEREFSAADLGKQMAIGGAIGGLTGGAGVVLGKAVSGARTAMSRGAKPGEGLADDAATAGRSACRTDGFRSFTATTPVLLSGGVTKPIGEIQVGDKVTATDPISGITRTEPVVALYEHQDVHLADVTVVDEPGRTATINTTQNHPFWNVTTGQWTHAAQLKPGEKLRKPDGTTITVAAVLTWTEAKPMYNIGVSNLHTYYVITDGIPVLVHNRDPDEGLSSGGKGGWTPRAATKVMRGGPFNTTYYQMPPDRLGQVYWWSRDKAGHGAKGEPQWKIFTETKTGLEWYADADKNGTYIQGKHKGETGLKISFKKLKPVNVTPGSIC